MNYDDASPGDENGTTKSDDTPTDPRKHHFELPENDYDPEKPQFQFDIPGFGSSEAPQVPPPRAAPKPGVDLPSVDGRGRDGDLWTLPSQQRGGLRVHSASSDDDDDAWKNDAIMHMNLAGR